MYELRCEHHLQSSAAIIEVFLKTYHNTPTPLILNGNLKEFYRSLNLFSAN
jgi:hypothetical protein